MVCFAASDILPPEVASSFGQVAERIISTKYLQYVGRPYFFPAPPSIDFMDISEGFGNSNLYMAYLMLHHPTLSVSQLADHSQRGLVKIPDLMTCESSRNEYYEVKPNSFSGRADGNLKLVNIEAFMHSFNLPYIPGYRWVPNLKHRLFSGTLLGLEVEVNLHFFKKKSGLILYDICVDSNTQRLTTAEIAAIITVVSVAVIAIVLYGLPSAVGGILAI